MKKIIYSITLFTLVSFLLPINIMAQKPIDGKVKVESRSNNSKATDTPGSEPIRHKSLNKRHFGGYQNFRRSGYANHYRMQREYGPGHYMMRRHMYSHHRFRNNQFLYRNFDRGELRYHGNNFRNQSRNRSQFGHSNTNIELKKMRDDIWRDGVMDSKERDLLMNKRKEFKLGKNSLPFQKDGLRENRGTPGKE